MAMICILAMALAHFEVCDAFDYPNGSEGTPAWYGDGVNWEARDGLMTCASPHKTFLMADQAPHGREVSIEATLVLRERLGAEWATAGVAVRSDASNFWQLSFVEAPDSMGRSHTVELAEMLDGQWLGQSNPETRLTPVALDNVGFNWQYNTPYRVRLRLSGEAVTGEILAADGAANSKMGYKLDNRAVTTGQPALVCCGFASAFDDALAVVDHDAPSPEAQRVSVPPYAIAAHTELKGTATGFFHAERIDGRDWYIDPNGYAFFALGTDHVNYNVHFCQKLGYAPYARNVAEKFGSEEKWAASTADRLADWNFNALFANHSAPLRHGKFPHINFHDFGASFASIDDLCPRTTWTGFPNVFSPKWVRHCDKLARAYCAPCKDDPWLIGYFFDNELEWFGKNYQQWGLFDEAWKKPAEHTAKRAWIAFLREQVSDPAELKTLWGIEVASFDQLAPLVEPKSPLNDRAKEIARLWVRHVAEEYYRGCAEAIRKYDSNHLVLGNRFAGWAPDVWDIAGRYCDVVTFNIYPTIDVERGVPQKILDDILAWHEKAGKPMMVTEWSFPALDAGLPSAHGAGMRVDTQAQRAQCFRHFQSFLFSLPFMIGSSYFMWADEPALGITDTFPEDSNYGLVNEKDEAYPELTGAAREVNAQVYAMHAAASPKTIAPRPLAALFMNEAQPVYPLNPEILVRLHFVARAGGMDIEGPIDGRAWRLSADANALGDFYGMAHQEIGQPLYTRSDKARVIGLAGVNPQHVTAHNDALEINMEPDEMASVDMELSHETGPVPKFRSRWQFRIPGDGAFISCTCLSVENTDTVPWRLAGVLYYVLPVLGGDRAAVEPMTTAPNYYRRGAAWINRTQKSGIGCWYPESAADYRCYFWKDPDGGLHPDLMVDAESTLEPGKSIELKNPPAFFFPLRDASLAEFGKAVASLEARVLP